MINLYTTQIDQISVHRVGNKSRNEPLFLSSTSLSIKDEQGAILKEYFLKPFREKEESYYCFQHEINLELNDVYVCIQEILASPEETHQFSKKIASILFEQSNHPHIKSGEVYVVHLSDMIIDNEKVDGVGIFKSESKHDFLQFEERQNQLEMHIKQGVSVSKLDKGCLIFNTCLDKGYKVLSIDTNRYDSKYWLEKFLQVAPLKDDTFFTKRYLKFCQNFAKDVVFPAEDKQQEVLFLNRAVDHFAKNDNFQEAEFLNEVIENPALIPEYHSYKQDKGSKYSIEDVSSFPIVNSAVSDARKSIKNIINLDTHIQIKMDFVNPDSVNKYVEKGWDEEREMYYYLVYFNHEQKN